MQVKNETKTGLSAEIKIVPTWAWTLAVLGFAAAQIFFNVVLASQPDAPPALVRALLGLLAGTILPGYLLLLGYVRTTFTLPTNHRRQRSTTDSTPISAKMSVSFAAFEY